MPEYMIFTSEMFEDAEIYWKNKLAGELDDLDIRGDYSRTGHYIKAYHKMTFSGPDIHELTHISKNNDLLLYIILLSVFKILISRYSGQDDIIVVSPVLKKSGQGYNTFIALKDILLPGMTFKEFLKAVKETVVEGYKHQHYPIWKLIKLLKWDDGPLFRYMFLLTNIHEHDGLEEIIEKGENDLIFSMDKLEGNLAGEITYNSQVFTAETIKRLEQCYMCILRSALSDTGAAVSNLEIMTPEEKKKLLFEFNDTQTSYPHDKTIHELFAQQVAQTPDVIALVARETREKHEKNEKHVETLRPTSLQHITYFQLNEQSNHLAGLLSEKGVRPDHIVAIMMKRSIEMVIGFLGILKAGGAYLPIDPNYPQERIDYMLKDSNVKVLITNKSDIRNPKRETNPNKTNLNDQNKKRNSGVSLV
ncbi:MAG: AMP-binding protein, partial [Acidobacteria bacterium]|nr:AMP-binding protein [Acidobacteriota bacterium]